MGSPAALVRHALAVCCTSIVITIIIITIFITTTTTTTIIGCFCGHKRTAMSYLCPLAHLCHESGPVLVDEVSQRLQACPLLQLLPHLWLRRLLRELGGRRLRVCSCRCQRPAGCLLAAGQLCPRLLLPLLCLLLLLLLLLRRRLLLRLQGLACQLTCRYPCIA